MRVIAPVSVFRSRARLAAVGLPPREMIISGAHCTDVSPCGRIAVSAARMSVETVVRSK